MGKSNKKSSFSPSSSTTEVASLAGLSTANKKKRKIENKAEKKKLLESAHEKSAPTDKKSKKKRKSASKDISAEDQKDMEMLDDDASLHISSKDISAEEKCLVSAEKRAPTVKKSKKKHKSSDDDDDHTSSKNISAEDQKANTPAKKLLKSSEKSAPTAKKSSSEDSPSEDISADQKDTKMVVNEDSHFVIYELFPYQILPKDSKTIFTKNIVCPPGRKITQADFEKFFRSSGKIVNVQIKLSDDDEELVELAEIEFESHDVAKRALRKHCREFFDTPVCVDVSREGSGPYYRNTDLTNERPVIRIDFGKDLRAGNVHGKMKDFFKSCGEINFATFSWDNETRLSDDEIYLSDGYAFVVYKYFESLSKALDLDGTEFMGAPMKITRPRVFVTSV